MVRLSQSFRIYVRIVAVYFRDSVGVRCRRFLFVGCSFAILGWDASERVTACAWLKEELWFGVGSRVQRWHERSLGMRCFSRHHI